MEPYIQTTVCTSVRSKLQKIYAKKFPEIELCIRCRKPKRRGEEDCRFKGELSRPLTSPQVLIIALIQVSADFLFEMDKASAISVIYLLHHENACQVDWIEIFLWRIQQPYDVFVLVSEILNILIVLTSLLGSSCSTITANTRSRIYTWTAHWLD